MISTCILIPSPWRSEWYAAISTYQASWCDIRLYISHIAGDVCIDTTMNSHRVEVWGSAIRIQLFCHAADIKHHWLGRSPSFVYHPNCMTQLNNCLHRRQMQTTHPHTSLILFYRRPRGVCAAIDIDQSTSSIEGVVDNSDTHKTCVVTSLE